MKRLLFALILPLAACVAPLPPPPPVEEFTTVAPQAAEPLEMAPQHAPPAQAVEWSRAGNPRVMPLTGGAAWLHAFEAVDAGGARVELELVVFDSRRNRLRVVDQPNAWAGGGAIDDVLRGAGAVAGVNGGFFSREFTPLGLMVAGGTRTGAWQSNKLLTGALVVSGGTPRLIWNAEGRRETGASDVLQAGPRLVDDGRAVESLDRSKRAARTFIVTDGGHRWALGVARTASLHELARLLAAPELIPGLRVRRALNFDGGHSTALYARLGDGREICEPGWSTVRNYVGVVPAGTRGD